MNVTLVVEEGPARTRTINLKAAETVVGRQKGLGLRIPSAEVSRRHCVLRIQDGVLTVEDLRSANGTLLNGKRITRKEVVRPGDRLEIGPLVFVVQYQAGVPVNRPTAIDPRRPRPQEEFVEVVAVEDEEVVPEIVPDDEPLPVDDVEEFAEPLPVDDVEEFAAAVAVDDVEEVVEGLPVPDEGETFTPVNLTPLRPEEVAALGEAGAVAEGIIIEGTPVEETPEAGQAQTVRLPPRDR
jgi:pSer/pThr/pTyr-binding forkhead associated (FHA) protein